MEWGIKLKILDQKGGVCTRRSPLAKTQQPLQTVVYLPGSGVYIPICSDGGIVQDYHMMLALAIGDDFLMMDRYFARFDESSTRKLLNDGKYVKEYRAKVLIGHATGNVTTWAATATLNLKKA